MPCPSPSAPVGQLYICLRHGEQEEMLYRERPRVNAVASTQQAASRDTRDHDDEEYYSCDEGEQPEGHDSSSSSDDYRMSARGNVSVVRVHQHPGGHDEQARHSGVPR